MFVFVGVIGSHGLLWHLVHDLIYIKINKLAAFSLYSLCIYLGYVGSHSPFLPNHQMVNTRNNQCNGQPSNNNNNNNANLEQLLNTQNQLMQAMLQTLNNAAAQPAASKPTSTTPLVSFGGVPANSPQHLLTSQRPHGCRRLAQGG
jgi:hypothetical protein